MDAPPAPPSVEFTLARLFSIKYFCFHSPGAFAKDIEVQYTLSLASPHQEMFWDVREACHVALFYNVQLCVGDFVAVAMGQIGHTYH